MKKITIHTPEKFTKIILETANKSGAGLIGDYDFCSFITKGIRTFRPLPGANPTVGEVNEINYVPEDKIEFICPDEFVNLCIKNMKKIHPYQEMAYDIVEILK